MAVTGIAGAAAAAIAQAIKASEVILRLNPDEFRKVMMRMPDPLIVIAEGGFFATQYQYLLSYKGLTFFTKSKTPLDLPSNAEVVVANQIWTPR